MRNVIILVPIIILSLSCRQNKEQSYSSGSFLKVDSITYEPMDTAEQFSEIRSLAYATANVIPEDSSEFYLINRPCAIMVFPDSSWINKQQKENGDNWDTIVDDTMYYMALASEALDSTDISIYSDLSYKRYMVFKGDRTTVLDKERMKETWAYILFNGKDTPVEWSGTDIQPALDSLFRKD